MCLLAVSSAVVLSMGPLLVAIGFGLSKQLSGRDFRFAITAERVAVRRARRSGK